MNIGGQLKMSDLYLFLDLDGVLTTPETNWRDFPDYVVDNLKEIIEEFRPNIVIHSTWCLHEYNRGIFEKLWKKYQFEYPYEWATTELQPDRKKRIYDIVKFRGITKYVIVDDEDYDWPRKHYIKTEWNGLTKEKTIQLAKLLKAQYDIKI
jgi:hypothetical protein